MSTFIKGAAKVISDNKTWHIKAEDVDKYVIVSRFGFYRMEIIKNSDGSYDSFTLEDWHTYFKKRDQ